MLNLLINQLLLSNLQLKRSKAVPDSPQRNEAPQWPFFVWERQSLLGNSPHLSGETQNVKELFIITNINGEKYPYQKNISRRC